VQVLGEPDEADEAVQDLRRLLDYVDDEVAANRNFEFLQALLRVVLQLHGDSIIQSASLRQRAESIRGQLRATWSRVDGLLQNVRCMVGFFGNLQT
jgi:U3 small nucleolar RNA-associated protein 21